MPNKSKLVRTQFEKDSTANEIAAIIRQNQDDWAKRYPERAHRLYPNVYDENGNRIKPSKFSKKAS